MILAGDYDMISDINDKKLRTEVVDSVGKPFHAEATKVGECCIFGCKFRIFQLWSAMVGDFNHI